MSEVGTVPRPDTSTGPRPGPDIDAPHDVPEGDTTGVDHDAPDLADHPGFDDASMEDLLGPDASDTGEVGDVTVPEHLNPDLIEPIRVVMAGLDSNVDAFAREAAREKLAKRDRKGPLWKRFAKNVWHTLSHPYQVVKETQAARQEILENENLRHHQGKTDEKWREDTVRRYSSDFGEALIHEEAGETFTRLSDPEMASNPNAVRIKDDVHALIGDYARGDITDRASFEMAFERMQEDWKDDGVSQEFMGEGRFLGENAFDMAEQAKAALDAVEGLSEIDREARLQVILSKTEIITGEAKVGSDVEIEATMSERLAEKMRGVPFINEGRLAKIGAALGNELVVAAMLSGVAFGLKKGMTHVLLPGLGSGIVAAFRERRAMLDERALHERRADNDQEANLDIKRQRQIEALRYEQTDSKDLIASIGELYDDDGKLKLTDRASLDAALAAQANIMAQLDLYYGRDKEKKSKIINFADEGSENISAQKFALDMALAKLQADLGVTFSDDYARDMLGITDEETYDDLLQAQKDITLGELRGEIDKQDELFNKLVAKRMMFRGGVTAVATILTGGAYKYIAGHAEELAEHLVHAVAEKLGISSDEAGELVNAEVIKLGQGMRPASFHESTFEGVGAAPEAAVPDASGDSLVDDGLSAAPDTSMPITTQPASFIPVGDHSGASEGIGVADATPADEGLSAAPDTGIDNADNMVLASNNTPLVPDEIGTGTNRAPSIPDTIGTTNGKAPTIPHDIGQPAATTGKAPTIPDHIGTPTDGKAPNIPDTIGNPGTTGNTAPEIPDVIGGEAQTGGSLKIGENTVNLPDGFSSEVHGNQVVITSPGGESFTAILNNDGSVSQQSLDQLKADGFRVEVSTDTIPGTPETGTRTLSAQEFYQAHKNEMVNIKHSKWMTNNTVEHDLNELGAQNKVMPDGRVRISIASMTSGGSFQGKSGIDWRQAAKDGHMYAYLSADRGSQAHAFEIKFDKDGYAYIDQNSPAYALFDKHGVFTGGYENISVKGDTDADGFVHIATLATVVGKHHKEFTETFTKPTSSVHTTYTIVPPNNLDPKFTTVPPTTPFVPPIGVPIYARRRYGEGVDTDTPDGATGLAGGLDTDDEDDSLFISPPTGSTATGSHGTGTHTPPPTPGPDATGTGTGTGSFGPSIGMGPSTGTASSPETDTTTTGSTSTPGSTPSSGGLPGTADDADDGTGTGAGTTTTAPDDDDTADDTSTSTAGGDPLLGTDMPDIRDFSHNDRPFVKQLMADTRAVPVGLRVDFRNVNPLVQKAVIVWMHNILAALPPRAAGETDTEYNDRVTAAIVQNGVEGMDDANMRNVPTGLKNLVRRTMAVLQKVRPAGPPPAP